MTADTVPTPPAANGPDPADAAPSSPAARTAVSEDSASGAAAGPDAAPAASPEVPSGVIPASAGPSAVRRQVGDWLLDADRHQLLAPGEARNIGAQNMALLDYFADRPGELLSREQLLDAVWRGVIVNDNTLTKAVADLRAQLGDDPRQPRYIITVPRRGYRLVAPVRVLAVSETAALAGGTPAETVQMAVPVQTSAPVQAAGQLPERGAGPGAERDAGQPDGDRTGPGAARRPSGNTHVRRYGWALPALALLLAAAALWQWPSPAPEQPVAGAYQRLTPLTVEPGIEIQPQFSPDGQWLTYVHFPPDPSATGQIHLLSLAGDKRSLPRPADAPAGSSPESPVFSPDGARLAYVLRDARSCQIRLLRFAGAVTGEGGTGAAGASQAGTGGAGVAHSNIYLAAQPVADDRPLADCAPTSRAIGVTVRWSADGRQLYYSAREQNVVRLMEHDWQADRRQAVPGIDWPVSFAVHPQQRQIAWSQLAPLSSRLMLLDRDSGNNRLLQERPELHLGVEWDPQGRGLLLASALAGGRLELLDLNGALHLLLLGIDPFYSPVFAPDGQRLALAQLQFSYDLWQKPLAGAAPPQPLIVGARWDYSPRFSHSGQRLAFISTRGGVPAVWISARDGSDIGNPFRLPENVWPVFLRWSPDDRYLLIGSSDLAIYRYDFVSGQLQRIGDETLQARNPTWSHDGRAIWASRKQGERWLLTRFELQDTASAGRTFADVMPAREVAYAEESPDGAWLYLLEPDARGRPQLRRYPCHAGDCALAMQGDASQAETAPRTTDTTGAASATVTTVTTSVTGVPGASGESLPIMLNQRQWQSLDVRNDALYFLREEQGMLTLHRWRADEGVTALMPILSTLEAGPMLIDFAISPDQRDVIYTRVADLQSALLLLEK